MFWAVKGNEPDYVTPLTGQDLKDAVDEHLQYMTNITKGKYVIRLLCLCSPTSVSFLV